MEIQPDSKLKRRVVTIRKLACYEQLESSIGFFLDIVRFFFIFSIFLFILDLIKGNNVILIIYLLYAKSTYLKDISL